MAIRYNPKDAASTIPAGTYPAKILALEDGTSKSSGQPMVTLTWVVTAGDRTKSIKDYFTIPGGLWKLQQVAAVIGGVNFDSGEVRADEYEGKAANLKIDIEPGNSVYPAKNIILGYETLSKPIPGEVKPGDVADKPKEEDIPF